MARSQYVYVVQHKGCITPLAAFTVKHELEGWLVKKGYWEDPSITIWRIRDVDQTITHIA